MKTYRRIHKETHSRAKIGGEHGVNGEWYKGGQFISTTDMPKKEIQKIEKMKTGKVEIAPFKWGVPEAGYIAIFPILFRNNVSLDTGTIPDKTASYFGINTQQRKELYELNELYKNGERWLSLYTYPEYAGVEDAVRLIENGMNIPDVLLKKVLERFPELKNYLEKR